MNIVGAPGHLAQQASRWLRPAGWWLAGVLLVLHGLRAATALPSGYDVEAFLGFTAADTIRTARDLWTVRGLTAYAAAYLALDLVLLIPLYAAVSYRIADWLRRRGSLGWPIAMMLGALVGVDVVETSLGLWRLDFPVLGSVAAVVAAALLWWVGSRSRMHPRARIATLIGLAVGLVGLMAAIGWRDGIDCAGHGDLAAAGCVAHRAKEGLLLALGAAMAASLLGWLCGLCLPRRSARASSRRADLRRAIADVVLRSRYVLIVIALTAGLLLGMDQSRDVLVGTIVRADGAWEALAAQWATLGFGLAALWTLSHQCWLWTRVMCRIPKDLPPAPHRDIEAFVKVWARTLGLAPIVVFALLAASTLHDLTAAGTTEGPGLLLTTNLVAIVFGGLFIYMRERAGRRQSGQTAERYFDDPLALSQDGRLRLNTWRGPRWSFWFLLPNAPVWLTLTSLVALFAVRLPTGMGWSGWPPTALPAVLLTMSVWCGVFGWLAVLERRQAVPWVLVLVAFVGILGAGGCTDNHVVWSVDTSGRIDDTFRMWLASASLALLIGAVGTWLVRFGPDASTWLLVLVIGLGGAGGYSVLRLADGKAAEGGALPPPESTAVDALHSPLERALRDWVFALRERDLEEAKTATPAPVLAPVPVYFVASEGGGARAAYWTARVLAGLASGPDTRFIERTFSISSVSGGSVGAAAFIACQRVARNDTKTMKACIEKLAHVDLVTPLLEAWLFEDAVARILPVAGCHAPACGFLSRGVWFEHVLEKRAIDGRQALRGGRPQTGHLPYLLLNSTWVENGQRAIASDLPLVTEFDFPSALDTLGILGADVTLVTAAHNSARFPFVNAIGSVHTFRSRCPVDLGKPHGLCGHLADGGYFDNVGSHTALDVLRALRRWLARPDPDPDPDGKALRDWAKQRLAPTLILIHNGTGQRCERAQKPRQPTPEQLRCTTLEDDWLAHEPPRGPLKLYADALGPLVTAVNVSGLGAHRRRAEHLLCAELSQLRRDLGRPGGPAYKRFPLVQREVLYPLGWYLSPQARERMGKEADRLMPNGESEPEGRCEG